MQDYKIRLHGWFLYESNQLSESDASEQYDFFKEQAVRPESGFTGIGVQLFHNGLCIRELAANATSQSRA